MDYEKKYKEALERARCLYSQHSIEWCDKDIVTIFPELAVSEDEKIRKEIKVILANTDLSQFALDYTFADMIAWLEKQGTSYTKKDVDDAFVKGMVFAKNELEKQGEQKSTDEDMKEALRMEYEKGRADVIADTLSWLANCWPQYCDNLNIIDGFKEAIGKE